jgi:hypothetical protein
MVFTLIYKKEMECQYCKRSFQTKYTLKTHQSTAKYCLEIQGKLEDKQTHDCSGCHKKFTSISSLREHETCCKALEINKLRSEYDDLQQELARKNMTIEKMKEEITQLKIYNAELDGNNSSLIDENNFLRNITKTNATRATKTTNNLTLSVFNKTDEELRRIAEEKYTKQHLVQDAKGLAIYAVDHVLKPNNPSDPPYFAITDISRCNAKFMPSDGVIAVDVGLANLTERVIESVKPKACGIISSVANAEEYKLYSEAFDRIRPTKCQRQFARFILNSDGPE